MISNFGSIGVDNSRDLDDDDLPQQVNRFLIDDALGIHLEKIPEAERLDGRLFLRLIYTPSGVILPIPLSLLEANKILQGLRKCVIIDDRPPKIPSAIEWVAEEVIGDRPFPTTREWLNWDTARRSSRG